MNRTSLLLVARLLVCLLSCTAIAQPAVQTDPLVERYELAGENRSELEQAVKRAPKEHRAAVEFLIQNMPCKDLQSLSAGFLLDNVKVAYEARAAAPWAGEVSGDLFFANILPYANVDEERENWRGKLRKICWPIVKDCKTTGEAAQELNKHLFKRVKVKYSTKRKKANQSPSESMDSGLASCTGLSILLADACRSVHVPARLTGIPSWSTKSGNHTWVEVWDKGDWHFTGAAEYNKNGLDRAWFQRDAALADKSKRMNSIYSISFARTDTVFPLVWSGDRENVVYAINVTDRYTRKVEVAEADPSKVQVRIRVWNAAKTERVAAKVTVVSTEQSEKEPIRLSGTSPTNTADMNDLLEFELQRGEKYELQIHNGDDLQKQTITTVDADSQVIDIRWEK